ncbi:MULTISPECIES: hypothetical protein [unclassified Amycolatopsis]|uniref:hypothetical protein n=1 Tax=unclassified Amycolatopsis TaxID=2618356 RepID=UPI001C696145|nr:hypothetical protein [Amycolatopsis sp. DSM 110486]QYN25036.1 hypothetical protein K1T34_22920 [Amycolatopsis sp. DSM 110486]
MTGVTKGLGLGAIIVITVGAVVLSVGSISYQASDSGNGANIGADVALTFGPYLVALGLILGIAAAVAHFTSRARQPR